MRSLKEVERYEDLAHYEWVALATKLGGMENVLAIIRGEKTVKIEDLIKLFDRNGRRIPAKGLQNNVCDPDKSFYLVQSQFKTQKDFARPFVRFCEAFHLGPLSVADFEKKTRELLDELESNKALANLLKGVYLPSILPQLTDYQDYGTTLEQVFLPAVESSYKQQFPNRDFYNYRKGELTNQVSIVEGSGHEKLIEKMKQGIVYAIYFPNPLQGFSVLASREQMKDLPESLLLAGGFDTVTAITMYPDILARDWHTPGYDVSTLVWRSPGYSLDFKAHDDELDFYHRAVLGFAYDDYSSGFLFLGSA
jgi:hypothetical protein